VFRLYVQKCKLCLFNFVKDVPLPYPINTSNTTGGRWVTGNSTYTNLKYRKQENSSLAEPVYFRKSGEKNVMSNEGFFNAYGGFEAISADLDPYTELLAAKRAFTTASGVRKSIPSSNLNPKRQARNETITYYTAEEAAKIGVFDKIRNYTKNNFDLNINGTYDVGSVLKHYDSDFTVMTARKPHHVSQMDVYSSDGRMYVYADPLYNYLKEEVTFAVNQGSITTNNIGYSNGKDNAIKNGNGLDHYYDKTITPAYPTAFLLSCILSSDYVDVDMVKGPSDEDLGNYTKFNYTTITNDFRWRTPFEAGKASYNEGFHTKSGSIDGDNKATYVYGKKDLKYLHSIETKTHVAEFILGDREDSYSSEGEYGGINTNHYSQRLEKINLYSKEDRLENGEDAVPIKTVHFKYNYSLCNGVDNSVNNGGKLTLEKVWFTYGESYRGKLSPYVFNYEEIGGVNTPVGYDTKSVDRWGNFQPNVIDYANNASGHPGNADYPFTNQDMLSSVGPFVADQHAYAWNLTSIELPSGGLIKVEYEADDYAFVQDRRAMQMFKIKGISSTGPQGGGTSGNKLYDVTGAHAYITVKLPDHYPTLSPDKFLKSFFTDINQLYFKVYANIDGENDKEYIFGYAEIDRDYYPNSSNGNEFTFRIKKSDGFHPFSMATFNFVKRHFPEIAYQSPKITDPGVLQIFDALIAGLRSIRHLVTGLDNDLKRRGVGQYIDLNKSWVRLDNPTGKKKGGGHRVKKITMNDNWNAMAQGSHSNSEYGQEYDYTMQDDYGNIMSSGVAAYEPILGNEENPFRRARFYDKKKLLIPDEEFYMEEPMGELFFPGASIGYRKVTVRNLSNTDVKKNATGKTVHEFYTAYDFPTLTDEVVIKVARKKPNSILKLLKLTGKDYVSTSQGYVVELNDMHGKPKAKWEYQENDKSRYSGVEYKYKQLSSKRIASRDLVIDKTGKISEKYIGVEMDLVADTRESLTSNYNNSTNFNADGFAVGIIPLLIPSLWPSYAKESVRFNSIVYNKVIKRHGLLKETIYYDQKSQIGITNNLLRDAESGEVLLTQSVNAFEDPIYSFSYPAYWAYDHMGPAYKSADISINGTDNYKQAEYLMVGDNVAFVSNSSYSLAWVSSKSASNVKFIDREGKTVAPASSEVVRIVRPARTNQQAQTVGSITSKENPMRDSDSDGKVDELSFSQVLQANVTQYTEQASIFCNCGDLEVNGSAFNPFVKGTRGIWKPWREFNYISDRTQTRRNDNVSTRNDGVFEQFTPFWTANSTAGFDWQPNYDNWIYTAEASIFNPYGNELESRDALGRYSSATFGYKHSLPTAVAKNAKYQHIAFDGFEDYGTEDCGDDHFSFEQVAAPQSINDIEAHTGKKSIKVGANSSYTLRKVIVECDK